MKNTKNYNLQKPDFNNVADIQILNDNFDKIDKGLTLDVGSSTGTGNDYVLNLGSITLSSANKGISFKFWADKDSNGAVTINGTYHLVKANGNPVKNLKRNAPYTITYDGNVNFFLASGGADESDSTTVGIDGSKVLAPETFIGSDGEIHTGTIPTRTAVNTTLKAGQSVSLDSGYYKDKSTIKAETLATAMSNAGVTLTNANQLVNGVKAVDKNGKLINGTATIQSLGGHIVRTFTGTATIKESPPSSGRGVITIPAIGFTPKVMHLGIGSNQSIGSYNPNGTGSFYYPVLYHGDYNLEYLTFSATNSTNIGVGALGVSGTSGTISYEFITWE